MNVSGDEVMISADDDDDVLNLSCSNSSSVSSLHSSSISQCTYTCLPITHHMYSIHSIPYTIYTTGRRNKLACWLAYSTNDREVGVRVPLATGGHISTVGQLLFAPWAWVYSTLHPGQLAFHGCYWFTCKIVSQRY